MKRLIVAGLAALALAACGDGISDENKALADQAWASVSTEVHVAFCQGIDQVPIEDAARVFNEGAGFMFTQGEAEQIVEYMAEENC
jgi:hypothetical protein